MICPYCTQPAALVTGKEVYPHRPDLRALKFWVCAPCDARCGCHPGTEKPLGRLANAELRQWKQKAHAAFDPIWKSRFQRKSAQDARYTKGMARGGRYKALAEVLGIPKADCHIGEFDVDLCRRTLEACQQGKIET